MARKAVKTAFRAFNFTAKKLWKKWDKNDCLSRIRKMPQHGIFDPLASLARNKRETRFLYHYGDINLSVNIDCKRFFMI